MKSNQTKPHYIIYHIFIILVMVSLAITRHKILCFQLKVEDKDSPQLKDIIFGILPQRHRKCRWRAKHQTGAPGTILLKERKTNLLFLQREFSWKAFAKQRMRLRWFPIEGLDTQVEGAQRGFDGRWR